MPVYIGKSGDLVGWHWCLTDWQTSEYRATQLVSSIKFKLSHATAIFETSQFFTLLPKLDTIQNDAYNRLLKMSMWWSCQGRGDALPCLDYLIADTERHAGERQRGQWLVSLKRHLNRSNDPIYIFGLCLLRSLTLSLSTGPQMIHGRWQKLKLLWCVGTIYRCVGTIYHKQFWLFCCWCPLRLSSSLLGRHRAICHSGLTLYLLPFEIICHFF